MSPIDRISLVMDREFIYEAYVSIKRVVSSFKHKGEWTEKDMMDELEIALSNLEKAGYKPQGDDITLRLRNLGYLKK